MFEVVKKIISGARKDYALTAVWSVTALRIARTARMRKSVMILIQILYLKGE
jgi:hypothetical protein